MRKEVGIEAVDVAKVLFQIFKLIQVFRWKIICSLPVSGFILAHLRLGTCEPLIKFTMMYILVSIPICHCMFCTCISHVLVWKARDPHDSIIQSSYQQFAERAEWFHWLSFAIVHAKHSPRKSGGKTTCRIHLLLSATLHWCKSTLIWLLVRTG